MADTSTTHSSAAAAPDAGGASTQESAYNIDLRLPAPGTAVDLESMLAGGGVAGEVGTGTGMGAGGADGADVQGLTSKVQGRNDSDKGTKDGGAEVTAVQAETTKGKDEDEGGDETGDAGSGDEPEEAEAIEKAKDKDVPGWVQPRLSKMAEQKRLLREQVADLERQLQEKLDAEAQAAEHPVVPLPSSMIAHLDTVEKVDVEVGLASDFLSVLAENPDRINGQYREVDGGPTVEEQVAGAKRYALEVIKHQQEHRKLLAERAAKLEGVRKSVPGMFKQGTEEHAFYQKVLRNPDLRTDPEFHQIIADAIRGRKSREELAKASKVQSPKSKVQGPTATSGTGTEVVKAPPSPVSNVAAAARSSVRTDDAPDPRARVWADAAKQKAVSVDEMLDAGVLSAA